MYADNIDGRYVQTVYEYKNLLKNKLTTNEQNILIIYLSVLSKTNKIYKCSKEFMILDFLLKSIIILLIASLFLPALLVFGLILLSFILIPNAVYSDQFIRNNSIYTIFNRINSDIYTRENVDFNQMLIDLCRSG